MNARMHERTSRVDHSGCFLDRERDRETETETESEQIQD